MSESITVDCIRCGKTFANKYSLKQHLEKENICRALSPVHDIARTLIIDELFHTPKTVQIIVHACKWCDKVFKQKSYLHIHENKCPFNDLLYEQTREKEIDANVYTTDMTEAKQICQDMDNLKSVMQDIKEIKEVLKNKFPINPQINNQRKERSKIDMNVNQFGHESLDHVSFDMLTEFVKNVEVVDLIQCVHFNARAPENHNVKRIMWTRSYYKNEFMKCYENGSWTHHLRATILKKLQINITNIMKEHALKLLERGDISDEEIRNLAIYLDHYMGNRNELKSIFALTLDDTFVDSKCEKISHDDTITRNNHEIVIDEHDITNTDAIDSGNSNASSDEEEDIDIDNNGVEIEKSDGPRKYCKKLFMKCWKIVNGKWTRLVKE